MGPLWVVIPARLASSRLPGKPLLDVAGVPLVEIVRRRASLARSASRVVVATDDEPIADAVRGFGGEVIRTGPAANGTHRVALAVGAADHIAVVNVQGDMPGVDPAHVDRVADTLASGASIVTLAAPFPSGEDVADPALVKVAEGPLFTRRAVSGARLHVGIYGFAPGVVSRVARCLPSTRSMVEDLEQVAWIDAGFRVTVVDVDYAAPGVDTPGQLDAWRSRLASQRDGEG